MDGTQVTNKIRFEKVATAVGTYWRSGATSIALRTHLRDLAHGGFFKVANLGGSSEEGFEQAFASLAYAYLKDKAPRLLDFMIGFQLVERNEDNTKAMGLFGFNLSGQWLYAPVFFLNGDLKGHELLYIKQQDTFVPMKENWVNYLMSRKPHVLGEESSQDTYQLGGMQPNLNSITGHGGMSKRAIDSWARPAMPLIAAMKVKMGTALYAQAQPGVKLAFDRVVSNPKTAALVEVAAKFDLNRVLPSHFGLLKRAFDLSQKSPAIRRAFTKFYGADCFSRWGQEVKTAAMRGQVNILPQVKQAAARPHFATPISLIPEAPKPIHPLQSGALQVYVYKTAADAADETFANLTEADREKLLHDTVLIKDERDPQATSQAYSTQVEQRLTNPHETGLYSVLERPNKFTDMLVICHPMSNAGAENCCTVVTRGSGAKGWLNTHPTNVWAEKVELDTDYRKWFEGLGDRSTLAVGGMYLAINASGAGTVPFEVKEVYGDGTYKVNFKDYCSYDDRRSDFLPRVVETDSYNGSSASPYGAKLSINPEGARGTKLKAIQGELRVPADFKFLKLQDPPKPKKADNEYDIMSPPVSASNNASETRPVELGKLEDIQLMLTEKTARLKLYDDHNELIISTEWAGNQRLTKRAALVCLVREHGLNEKTSRELIKQAEAKRSQTFRIKYAPGFGTEKQASPLESVLRNGPGAPAIMPPNIGYETYGRGRNGARTQDNQEDFMPVIGMESSRTDPNTYDNWLNYTHEDFQHTQNQAQQAAQSGQKEVFDTSMISGMLKSVRQDSLVDRYLGDLMKALDKLGRILFLFYWHQEEFEDRYGKSELPEMEDSLRNSYESLGDITLFLKEKTVEPGFDADPNIEETARN